MIVAIPTDQADAVNRLRRVTGAAGITITITTTVVGASVVDGYQNMPVTADTAQVVDFFQSLDDTLGWSMSYTSSLDNY